MSDITFADLLIAARTVFGEARGESQQGKLAVSFVLRNRMESGKWFGGRGTLTSVCLMPRQFSCWNADDPNHKIIEEVTFSDETLQKCLYAVLGAVHGFEEDPTNGSCHYFAWRTTEPEWAKGKKPECRIGGHAFFKGIN